jgi:hypothetical protein
MFVTLFWGFGSAFDDVIGAWAGRYRAWPSISTRPVTLSPGETHTETIWYETPSYVPVGTTSETRSCGRGSTSIKAPTTTVLHPR